MSTETTIDPADWIDRYLGRYRKRFDPFDWPTDPDGWFEFVAGWVDRLRTYRVTEGEANAAALQLAGCPPRYRNDHLPAVLEVVKSMRAPNRDPIAATAAERQRRQHEAMIRAQKRERLEAKWEALPAGRRDAIRAQVIADNPGLAKWEHFVLSLCLAAMEAPR